MSRLTVQEKRRTLLTGWRTSGPARLAFATNQPQAIEDASIRTMPGRQNKHHGRGPGTYKRRRNIVRASRRRNRS